ncbi:MAG TPA: hypothetical protein VID68_12665 [Solirubrobacteraceae bacterium]|jgi:hypothetical protein
MTSATQSRHEAIRDTGDIAGYRISAPDGTLGHVSKLNNATSTEILVIDTGRWIFGKSVVLPIDVIEDLDHEARVVTVRSSTDEIRGAPEYVEGHAQEPLPG